MGKRWSWSSAIHPPDVWKTYTDLLHDELVDLDERDGWVHLVNACDARRDSVIVVNTAARSNSAVRQYGSILDSSLSELGRMGVLWVINRQRDSLELLKEFMDTVPHADVHVVRNRFFGEEKKFELYNGSKIRAAVETRGGKSVDLPDLADRVADDLYIQRMPREAPFWIARGRGSSLRGWHDAAAAILSVPAGWMALALLVPHYYIEWHMREASRPILFADEDQAAKETRDPVAPALDLDCVAGFAGEAVHRDARAPRREP